MPMTQRLRDYLEKNSVRYSLHEHPEAYTARQVARAESLPPHEVAKAIVFYGDHGYGMAVLPANRLVDVHELRTVLGFSRLRLATEEEIGRLFPDAELGAMAPFGNLYGIPVYVDSDLALEEQIAFNAGTHRETVHMKFTEFVNLVKPTILAFSKLT
jgi:Ala-tRNA(Pro) deacylase